MKTELKDLQAGDRVWCGGNSGFCDNGIETVRRIDWKFDEDTGEKYKVIILSGGRKFDSRNGKPITPPTAYFIKPTEQSKWQNLQ
jgi:hypothetical protein